MGGISQEKAKMTLKSDALPEGLDMRVRRPFTLHQKETQTGMACPILGRKYPEICRHTVYRRPCSRTLKHPESCP
jgi:hypothetical protein